MTVKKQITFATLCIIALLFLMFRALWTKLEDISNIKPAIVKQNVMLAVSQIRPEGELPQVHEEVLADPVKEYPKFVMQCKQWGMDVKEMMAYRNLVIRDAKGR